ncbi:MAG: hypothetical protein ACOC0P_04180 [Planctomycetota bacterium]
MLKFLRKYRAVILAVGGSLLMVAFLLPQAIQTWAQTSFQPIEATYVIDGVERKVEAEDFILAENELRVLSSESLSFLIEQLFYPEGRPVTDEQRRDPAAALARQEPVVDDPSHWYLLRLEAERMGLIGAPEEGRLLISNFFNGDTEAADQFMFQIAGQASGGMRRLTLDDAYEAIGAYLGVSRLVQSYRGMGLISEPRLQDIANRFNEAVETRIVFLRADQFIDEIAEPTEDELEAHLARFAAYEPGEGPYGIGYRQPDRFMLEYLTVDYDSVLDSVEATGLDARTWYLQNEDLIRNFAGTDEEPAAEAPPYAEHVADAMLLYRRHLADQKLNEIVRFISGELLRSTSGLPRNESYRVLPEDWAEQRIDFESLAAAAEEKFPGIDVQVTSATDGWMTEEDLFALRGINRASRLAGNRQVGLRDLIGSAREFGEPVIPGVQAGLTDPQPLRSSASITVFDRTNPVTEDVFFYRLAAVDPARPAESVDEIRDDAIANVKRIKAFEQLAAESDMWRQRAISEGLDTLAEEFDRRPMPAQASRFDQTTYRFARELRPGRLPGAGESEELVELLFDRARELEGRIADAGENAMIEDLPLEERLVVLPIEDSLGLALAEVVDIRPMTLDDYIETARTGIETRQSDPQFGAFMVPRPLPMVYAETILDDEDVVRAFSFETLSDKYDFVVLNRNEDAEEELDEELAEEGASASDALDPTDEGADIGSPDIGEAPGNLPTPQAPATGDNDG